MSHLAHGRAGRGELVAGGVAVATLESGAGEPVLLVPGYTGSKEDFAPLLDPLADAGYRAVAIDLPGQFETPGHDDPDAYSTARLGALVAAVVAALGPGVRLLGHSFGGLVCRSAVLDGAGVRSLVLLSSGPAAIEGRRRTLIELLEPVLVQGGVAGVYAAAQAVAVEEPDVDPDVAAFLQRRFLAQEPAMLTGMGLALRGEADRVAELAASDVPVLVVHGETDDAWPPKVQQDMAARLGARYAVIPDAAHSAAVENPAALLPVLLDFWS